MINFFKIAFATCSTPLILSSCGSLFTQKILLGVRKPSVKSSKEITKFQQKHKINESTYTFSKDAFLLKLHQSSSYLAKWEIYDKNGYKLVPNDTNVNQCNGYTHAFLKNIPNANYTIDSTINLFHDTILQQHVQHLDGSPVTLTQNQSTDYYLIIFWATFMGKYSSNLFQLKNTASNNPNVSLQTLLINMDFKENYGISNKDIEVSMRVKK